MAENQPIIAAHYFYFLKEDRESLRQLWSYLDSDAGADQAQPGLTGQLEDTNLQVHGCSVLHCARQGELDFCLAMLPDLAVIEIISRSQAGPSSESWRKFLSQVDDYRGRATADGLSLFGETTLLITVDESDAVFADIARDLTDECQSPGGVLDMTSPGGIPGQLQPANSSPLTSNRSPMVSDLDPDLCGGGQPRLYMIPGPEAAPVDHYALAAADPERVATVLFPAQDALQKGLSRSASYFSQQRQTIVDERADVDSRVGALLHKQVVTTDADHPETASLEINIANLSRMFGLLATDSLLMRQADKRLEQDLGSYKASLGAVMSRAAGTADEIGEHFLGQFEAELKAVRNVIRDLDYSRQNAEAAIEVIRTQIELLRAREGALIQDQTKGLLGQMIRLQEEGLAIQVAAGVIEFVLIFYYVLISWEHLLGIEAAEHIPPLLRMLPVLILAGGGAIGTHYLARSIKNKTWRNTGLWISAALIVLSLAALVIFSVTLT